MNDAGFDSLYDEELDGKLKKVLHLFLKGHTEKEIADQLGLHRSSINRYLSKLCNLFLGKIPKAEWQLLSQSDRRFENQSRQEKLINLFREKKPELVSSNALQVNQETENEEIYLERELLDSCREKLSQVGILLRIKAPKQWGKTLLINRLLEKMEQQGYQTAYVDVLDADKDICENLDRLLQWFCLSVGLEFGVAEEKLQALWNKKNGIKSNSSKYFTDVIFPEVEKGFVLAVDNVDRIFPCPTAEDFLSMLRAWFDKTKGKKKWSKFRLIVAHATECYVPMNLNQSPFNVGESIGLSEFNFEQVKELAGRQGVSLNDGEIERLMRTIGGHPFLVDRAIASLKYSSNVSLDDLLGKAATLEGIYGSHLLEVWGYVREREELVTAMKEVVNGTESVALKLNLTRQLDSLGVVKLDGNKPMPRCDLYREFFKEQLVDNS